MNKATPEEIAILKRIAEIVGINHKIGFSWNKATDQDEECDCFYANHRGVSFEWHGAYDSFDDFIKDYAQYKCDCGYSIAWSW